jgi:CRP/FNR family cyclic AMP-dependent transcriptional regulator
MAGFRRPSPLPLTAWPPGRGVYGRIPGVSFRVGEAGQAFRAAGVASTRFGVVLVGAVGLFVGTHDGGRACLAVLAPGDVFGTESVLPSTPHPTGAGGPPEVRAVSPCRVASIPAAEVLAAAVADPAVGGWLTGALARHIEIVQRRLGQTLTLPAEGRILAALDEMARSHGRPVSGGVRVDLPLTQEILGQLVGATRETVNRAISQLERSGRLWRSRGRYVVPSSSAVPEAIAP